MLKVTYKEAYRWLPASQSPYQALFPHWDAELTLQDTSSVSANHQTSYDLLTFGKCASDVYDGIPYKSWSWAVDWYGDMKKSSSWFWTTMSWYTFMILLLCTFISYNSSRLGCHLWLDTNMLSLRLAATAHASRGTLIHYFRQCWVSLNVPVLQCLQP